MTCAVTPISQIRKLRPRQRKEEKMENWPQYSQWPSRIDTVICFFANEELMRRKA